MPYTIDQFAADCRAALLKDPGPTGRERVRQFTEKACADRDFVAKLSDRMQMPSERFCMKIPICISAFSATSTKARKTAPPMITGRAGRFTVKPPE